MSFAPVEQFERLYKVHEVLGHGQYAVVKRCVHRASGQEFAVKFVKKRRVGTSRRGAKRADIEREIEILRKLGSHENIVHLQEVYESATDVILILEYISGGELFHHVCSKEKLCEEEASAFIKQILIGVSHLHNNFVAHLDLKPENIMLQCKSSTRIKIIDFGLSRTILPGDSIQEMIGTPEFVAPEVVEYENLSSATDMWAIGVVTYILLSGMSPFMGESRDATFANITSVNYDFDDDIFSGTSNLAKDFISRLFVRDPKRRSTCEQSLQHPWIEPQAIEQATLRRECAINLNHMRTFHAKKRWKQSLRAVTVCNRIISNKAKNKSKRFDCWFESNQLVMNALMCASEEGNLNGLEELLNATRVDLNAANELGETAVHIAAGSGQLEILQYLQYRGANVAVADKHGDTPLYWASRHGHVHVVNYLLKESIPVNCLNKCKESAMHIAARYGHINVVECLLNFDCDVNLQDEHGETPCHIACWHGFNSVLDVLVKAKPDLNIINKEHETALHCAAVRGHLECVQTLLANGADVDVADKNNQIALHLAIRRRHIDIALLLLQYNCKLDIEDINGDTPLHLACKENLLSVAQTLCHLGCKVDVVNKATQSPLHMAAKEGQLEIVRLLCLSGANINLKNKDGITPEISALAQGYSSIGELLARLKNDQLREMFIEQLCPGNQVLKRIKMKLFGHTGVGKTKLLESLKAGLLGSFFRRKSEGAGALTREDSMESNSSRSKIEPLVLPTYTKGIDIQQANIPGCGELSLWDFGGYQPYQQIYDHFVGNADCIHLILFKVTDPTETQYQQVVYWMNFLKSRILPTEPIGHCSRSSKPAYVVLVGTHADMAEPPLPKKPDGEWTSCEAEAMLKTVAHRFSPDFDVHKQIVMVDALQPNCPGLKLLKTYLAQCRNDILQGLPKATGLLEAAINHLSILRKNHAKFPVLSWPEMINVIRKEINPLAAEMHCRQLIQQLQLIGEVVYIKGEIQEFDCVILNPNWLCHDLLGQLLSMDFLLNSSLINNQNININSTPKRSTSVSYSNNDAVAAAAAASFFTESTFNGRFTADQLVQMLANVLGDEFSPASSTKNAGGGDGGVNFVHDDGGAAPNLLQLLDACGLCAQYENDAAAAAASSTAAAAAILEYELPCLIQNVGPKQAWDAESERRPKTPCLLLGGVRLTPPHGMDFMMATLFPRIQVHLRRSMVEFQDALDGELRQWKNCSRISSGNMEAQISLFGKDQNAVEILIRAPAPSPSARNSRRENENDDSAAAVAAANSRRENENDDYADDDCAPAADSRRENDVSYRRENDDTAASCCFYFGEDLLAVVEQTCAEVAPGLPLERHFLSPRDLRDGKFQPTVYTPADVMEMQVQEKMSLKSRSNDDDQSREESFLDVVCFGSREVALSLTLGVDLPVARLPLHARREMASLLDLQDSMGRDWSILAVKLGLTETLPDVDGNGQALSRTDQILTEWSYRNPHGSTVGTLIQFLKSLERADVYQTLYKCVPLYILAPINDDSAGVNLNNNDEFTVAVGGNRDVGKSVDGKCNDSGVVMMFNSNGNSQATSATSTNSAAAY